MKSKKHLEQDVELRLPDSDHLKDREVADAIVGVLSRNWLEPPDTVRATVTSGQVTLNGEVGRWGQRDAIERAVQIIPSVTRLTNLLTVKPEVVAREMERTIVEAQVSPW